MVGTGVHLSDGVVTVRALHAADGPDVFGYLSVDPEIARWTRIPWPYTEEHLEQVLGLVAQWHRSGSDFAGAIVDSGDGRLLGCCGLHRIGASVKARSAFLPNELGYWVGEAARGRGVATRAVRLVSRYALLERGCTVVNLQTKVGNVPSGRVARSAGFQYVGTVPAADIDDDDNDHDRYELRLADINPSVP